MHYAALDAHVLVQIFSQQMIQAKGLGYDIVENKNVELIDNKSKIEVVGD